ncbi:MAG: hypothetical protein KDJ38_15435 [Gammaproteobacteria bacterium]|nr:hypothetical protein [Gammaproteobacteria bacterium]
MSSPTRLLKWITATLLLLNALAIAGADTRSEDIRIPDNALGLVLVEKPMAGTLPFLFGLKGEGRYITRNDNGELCQIARVPLLAGGFNGDAIGVYSGDTVKMAIYNEQISKRLREGRKVVSGDYTFSLGETAEDVDIRVLSGLNGAEGFILHPKRRWFSWVISDYSERSCDIIAGDANTG